MDEFKPLQEIHLELLKRQEKITQRQIEKFAAEVKDYINKVIFSSGNIVDLDERDQLRAILRYWASYYYQVTGTYLNTTLRPPEYGEGRDVIEREDTPRDFGEVREKALRPGNTMQIYIIGFVALVILIAILVGLGRGGGLAALFNRTPTFISTAAESNTSTATYTPTPSETPEITTTPTITVSPTPTKPSGQPDVGIDTVRLLNPMEGETLESEIVDFTGTYTNFQEGVSIHLVVQPISSGRLFPLNNFFPVDPQISFGDWAITGRLPVSEELTGREDYNMRIVVATGEDAQQLLQEASGEGYDSLDQLPVSTKISEEIITISYEPVLEPAAETRIIFTYIDPDSSKPEIFSIRPDGTDLRRIALAPLYGEIQPSLSPDGSQAAFLSRVFDENQDRIFTLFTLDLENGGEPVTLFTAADKNVVFETPIWSPNGDTIALSVFNGNIWDIFLVDTETKEAVRLTGRWLSSARYPYWNDENTIVFTTRVRESSGFMSIDIETRQTEEFYDRDDQQELWGAVSPEGTHLAYLIQPEGDRAPDLFVIDLESRDNDPIRLTDDFFQDQSPVWDPDGESIYYVSFETVVPSIQAVDSDGSNQREVFEGDFGITHISIWPLPQTPP